MRSAGFVLVTLLILLLVLSLLAVHAMNSSLLQVKMGYNFFAGFQRINDADRVLQRAEAAIERNNNWSCFLNVISADYVLGIKNTRGLDALASCRTRLSENGAENREGHYVIQAIPDEVSEVCVDEKNADKIAYYRITSWVKAVSEPIFNQGGQSSKESSKEGILVQSTYAKLLNQRIQKTCMRLPQVPKSTRLSWRVVF